MTARTTVAAATSPWVAERVAGPPRTVPVVARGSHAAYVDVGGAWIGVLAARAVWLPCGLRTTRLVLPEAGDAAVVGGGSVSWGRYDVRVRRLVDPGVPRLPGLERSEPVPAGAYAAYDDSLAAVRAELPEAALSRLADGAPAAVDALLGRGGGLTPVGDDVLAGWLVTRRAAGRPCGRVADAVEREVAAGRTAPLSATLLLRAAVGETIPQLRDVLQARHAGESVEPAMSRLLAVGHTSGAGLALGSALALDDPLSVTFSARPANVSVEDVTVTRVV